MAKKSAAELKDEGTAIADLIATARKRPLNFALLVGKEGVVLEAHPKKGTDLMRRQAKQNGGGAKGVQGVMNVKGKVIELACEDDDAPASLPKLAKKHFAERGLKFKILLVLPGGGTLDDGEDDGDDETDDGTGDAPVAEMVAQARPLERDADTAGEAVRGDGGGTPPAPPPSAPEPAAETDAPEAATGDAGPGDIEKRREKLAAGLRALFGDLRAAIDAGPPEKAAQLKKAAAAFGTEVKGDNLDRAEQLLNALRKAVGAGGETAAAPKPPPEPPAAPKPPDLDALRAQLRAEFATLEDDLRDLAAKAGETPIGKKAAQLAAQFESVVSGAEPAKAAGILALLRRTILAVLATGAAPQNKLTEAEREDKAQLAGFGLSDAEQTRLALATRDDPDAIERAIPVLTALKAAKVPEARMAKLLALSDSDPATYTSAVAALESVDPGGALDVSRDAIAASLAKVQEARVERSAKLADWQVENAAKTATDAEVATRQTVLDQAAAATQTAQDALDRFTAGLGDLAALSVAESGAAARQSAVLINALEDARKAEAAAGAAHAAAVQQQAESQARLDTAAAAYFVADDAVAATKDTQEKLDRKKDLLDALTFGPLSADAPKPIADADKAKLVDAYGRDPGIAQTAIALASSRGGNAEVVAANVGPLLDRFEGGFADSTGTALVATEDQKRAMAGNALRMGAQRGQGWFDGFAGYLDNGKQHEPDPTGGMDPPLEDRKEEAKRKKAIALKRTTLVGDAAMGGGTVDFSSAPAKAAMDQMLYHPGSLTVFTPQMTGKMEEVRDLFTKDETRAQAQAVIAGTTRPAEDAPGRAASDLLVAGTLGLEPDALGASAGKTAVLSAMMTPLSQGPVGSCFATAPVRGIRETDPLRAMQAYADIASTGEFKTKQGKTIPANINPPAGENPLMRSWEYSVAAAGANLSNSKERGNLSVGLFGAAGSSDNLWAVKDIVGAAAWNDSADPTTGDLVPGIANKLMSAVNAGLTFQYNAGPPVGGGPPGGGGGDGHSTDGAFEVVYKGKALKSEAEFKVAIQEIALAATGETADTEKGGKIVTLVTDPKFTEALLKGTAAGKYTPWALGGGGMETEATRVLDGGTPARDIVMAKDDPPKPEGERTLAVLNAALDVMGGMGGEMEIMGTTGAGANHAFNGLPKHKTVADLQGPDRDAKIEAALLKPGRDMASHKMPVEQSTALFEKQVRAVAASWGSDFPELMADALARRPAEAMTAGELKAHTATVLADFKRAYAGGRTDAWKTGKQDAGEAFTPEEETAEREKWEKAAAGWIEADTTAILVETFQPPEVVIADTNWGGPEEQVYFVVAPDPSTGELRMWKKSEPNGKLTPAGKQWADATWDRLKK